jgi:Zn ribbon nucleic-acid-binding protein
VWAKCPNCGWTQKIRARKKIECFRCGYTYAPKPKRRRRRMMGHSDTNTARRRRMWGSSLAWGYVMGSD